MSETGCPIYVHIYNVLPLFQTDCPSTLFPLTLSTTSIIIICYCFGLYVVQFVLFNSESLNRREWVQIQFKCAPIHSILLVKLWLVLYVSRNRNIGWFGWNSADNFSIRATCSSGLYCRIFAFPCLNTWLNTAEWFSTEILFISGPTTHGHTW